MALQRHIAPRSPNRVDDATLLRAARECMLDHGIRRSTLTEIARRAGVSRMTLYRHFPDVTSIVAALLTAEFREVLRQAGVEEDTGPARTRLVTALVRAVGLLRSDPLLGRVVETDAELLLPYLTEYLGSIQQLAEQFIYDYLRTGHADGSIRRADPAVQARVLLMSAQSFVVSARPAATDLDTDDLIGELAHLLDAALRPEKSVEIAPLVGAG